MFSLSRCCHCHCFGLGFGYGFGGKKDAPAAADVAAVLGNNVARKELKKQKDLNDCFHMRIHLSLCKDLTQI